MLNMEYVERLESGIDERDDKIVELNRKVEELQEQLDEYKRYMERLKVITTNLYNIECMVTDAQVTLTQFTDEMEV